MTQYIADQLGPETGEMAVRDYMLTLLNINFLEKYTNQLHNWAN